MSLEPDPLENISPANSFCNQRKMASFQQRYKSRVINRLKLSDTAKISKFVKKMVRESGIEVKEDSNSLLEEIVLRKFRKIEDSVMDFKSDLMSEMLERVEELKESYKEQTNDLKESFKDRVYDLKKSYRERICSLEESNKELEKEIDELTMEKTHAHKDYFKRYCLPSLRMYVEFLEREFNEDPNRRSDREMEDDLRFEGVHLNSSDCSREYLDWLWYLNVSGYSKAIQLRRSVDRRFKRRDDFIQAVFTLCDEAASGDSRPSEPFECEDVKRGLKLLGLDSKNIIDAVDVLYSLKKPEVPDWKRKRWGRISSVLSSSDSSSSDSSSSDSSSSDATHLDEDP